jgi:hypothetical protein
MEIPGTRNGEGAPCPYQENGEDSLLFFILASEGFSRILTICHVKGEYASL